MTDPTAHAASGNTSASGQNKHGVFDRVLDRKVRRQRQHRRADPIPWRIRPPKSFAGLPWDLTSADFADADSALATGQRQRSAEPFRSRISECYLDGTEDVANATRIGELCAHHTPRRFVRGVPVYPALLAPDPAPDDNNGSVAVIAKTGYIGSLPNHEATNHHRVVEHSLDHGYFYVIDVSVDFSAGQFTVQTRDTAH